MYKHCNTEDSARRQRQLEQYLLELMEDVPYSGITIGQICQQAGISRKSFMGRTVESRGPRTLELELQLIAAGASVVRTHDVRALRQAMKERG